MANPHKGDVSLEIGGGSYTLRLDIDAICSAEAFYGKAFGVIVAEMQQVGVGACRALFVAALAHQHPGMSSKAASDLIQQAGLPLVIDRLTLAIALAFPKMESSPQNPQ